VKNNKEGRLNLDMPETIKQHSKCKFKISGLGWLMIWKILSLS